jgi:four helix bundle protein
MAYHSFEDLDVWKKSCSLAVKLYKLLKACSDYGLKDQMTRAAVSIASNIAEGAERDSIPEFIRFLHIAKGPAAELRTQIYIAYKIDVISKKEKDEFIEEIKSISSMFQVLIKHQKNILHKS